MSGDGGGPAGLEALLRPRSVAVVGASGREGNPFARPLQYLRQHRFGGEVYPVNPRYEELSGWACYPSLGAAPGPVDLALVLVPAGEVARVVREGAEVGVRAAVVFASGFAETGEEGRALQDELAEAGRRAGTRLLGPNCQGAVYVPARLAATFSGAVARSLPGASGVAYVGQSGALGGSILDLARESGMGLTAWVSTGNQADADAVEVADLLLGQDDVSVVATYLESAVDGRRYAALARRAGALGKRLVVLRSGRSAAGRRAAASHTGAMVAAGAAFELVSRDEGVVLVDDVDELLRVAYALSALPAPRGSRVSVVTTSGGAGSLAADHLEERELVVEELPAETRAALAPIVPAFGSTANPVDVTAQLFARSEHAFADVCRAVLDSAGTDVLVVLLTMVTGEAGRRLAADLVELARDATKPVLVAWLAGDEQTAEGRRAYREGRLPLFRSVGDVARTLRTLLDAAPGPRDRPGAERVAVPSGEELAALLAAAGPVVTEAEGGAFLDAVGVARPEGALVRSGAEAEAAARRIGGRVAMKVQSPGVVHKTDAGGVRLGVPPEDAASAYEELLARVAAVAATADVRGVLVQATAPAGRELVVGVTASDDGFPPVATVGFGGVATEVYRDVASRVVPVGRREALEMLRSLRGAPLLFGHRNLPPADVEAAADAVARLCAGAEALGGRLRELEVNPLIVHPDGGGAVAADFVARTGGAAEPEEQP